jgi:tetratricopeptide (TPR) repeat protein
MARSRKFDRRNEALKDNHDPRGSGGGACREHKYRRLGGAHSPSLTLNSQNEWLNKPARSVDERSARSESIRPLPFAAALWRSITETWARRNRSGFRDEEVVEEVDCPDTDYTKAVDCPITEYAAAIESNPNNVTAYLGRGTHFKAFAFDSAIADFTKAIELKPTDDSAYTQRGSAYYEKAEFDRAIADFTKALELNPRSALAYCNLGWSYEAVGNEKKAIAHYRKALELDPSLEAARDNLKLLGATPERQPYWQTKPKS